MVDDLKIGKNVRYSSGERGVLLWMDQKWVLVRHHGADAPCLWMRDGTKRDNQ